MRSPRTIKSGTVSTSHDYCVRCKVMQYSTVKGFGVDVKEEVELEVEEEES